MKIAGLENEVTFFNGDITLTKILDLLPPIDAAFIDPDWVVNGGLNKSLSIEAS